MYLLYMETVDTTYLLSIDFLLINQAPEMGKLFGSYPTCSARGSHTLNPGCFDEFALLSATDIQNQLLHFSMMIQ